MRLFLLFATLTAAATLAACDSTSSVPTCPDTGVVTVADSSIGTGQPASGSVVVRYTGRLASDGTVFDSGTAQFALSGVILGFAQGIGGRAETDDAPAIAPMRANGGRRIISIPANFGYRGIDRGVIPPCSDLVFDVTLIEP